MRTGRAASDWPCQGASAAGSKAPRWQVGTVRLQPQHSGQRCTKATWLSDAPAKTSHESSWYHRCVLLADAPLTLREFVTHEEVPLATIFREVLEFLQGSTDAVLFGAHAVNAYCDPERMTQDVDLLSTHAAELAEQLRLRLTERLRIAVRVREVVPGLGYRVYQLRKPSNRHLVDVRQAEALPSSQPFGGVRVIEPSALIAMKVVSLVQRAGRPKAGTDLVDVQRLLLALPKLKAEAGPVLDRLRSMSATDSVLSRWREIAQAPIEPDEDEGY